MSFSVKNVQEENVQEENVQEQRNDDDVVAQQTLKVGVYWAARKMAVPALENLSSVGVGSFVESPSIDGSASANHHFILVTGDKTKLENMGFTVETEGEISFATVGGFVPSEGEQKLVAVFNQETDIEAVKEYINPTKPQGEHELQVHSMDKPSAMKDTGEFQSKVFEISKNYEGNQSNAPDYSAFNGPNCSTWANSTFKVLGVPNDERVEKGEFVGIDVAEEEVIKDLSLYDSKAKNTQETSTNEGAEAEKGREQSYGKGNAQEEETQDSPVNKLADEETEADIYIGQSHEKEGAQEEETQEFSVNKLANQETEAEQGLTTANNNLDGGETPLELYGQKPLAPEQFSAYVEGKVADYHSISVAVDESSSPAIIKAQLPSGEFKETMIEPPEGGWTADSTQNSVLAAGLLVQTLSGDSQYETYLAKYAELNQELTPQQNLPEQQQTQIGLVQKGAI